MILIFFAGFMLLGIAAGLQGTALAFLIERFGIAPDQGGIFITLFTVGTITGTYIIGRLLDRVNARVIAWVGVFFLGIGALIVSAATTSVWAFLALTFYGFGFGAMLVCGNVLVVRISAPNSAPALNALSVCFAIGGIVGPEITTAILVRADVATAYAIFAAAAFLMLPLMLRVHAMPPARITQTDGIDTRIPLTPILLFAAFFMVYTGAEIGFTSWIYTQMHNIAGLPVQEAARAVSLFWIGMVVGRLIGIPLTQRVRDEVILIGASALLSITVALLLMFATNPAISMIAVALFGLFAGPIFSSALAMVGRRFPHAAGSISGTLLALGNIGVGILPFVQGQVGRGIDGGYIVTLIAALVLIALAVLLARDTRRASLNRLPI